MDEEKLLLVSIFNKYYTLPNNKKGITVDSLIDFIASGESSRAGALGYSAAGWTKFIKRCFPDKNNRQSYKNFLLSKDLLKYCPKCASVLPYKRFSSNKTRIDGYMQYCKDCQHLHEKPLQTANQAKVRANRLRATPTWSDLRGIKEFYKNRPKGYHVDHIVPLQGTEVCGLHVLENLQYLTAEENLKKGNKFTPG